MHPGTLFLQVRVWTDFCFSVFHQTNFKFLNNQISREFIQVCKVRVFTLHRNIHLFQRVNFHWNFHQRILYISAVLVLFPSYAVHWRHHIKSNFHSSATTNNMLFPILFRITTLCCFPRVSAYHTEWVCCFAVILGAIYFVASHILSHIMAN